jgi:hypothetical protein
MSMFKPLEIVGETLRSVLRIRRLGVRIPSSAHIKTTNQENAVLLLKTWRKS